jgi:plastocyanin
MALNFPADPEVNDIYTSGANSWRWNGTTWNIISAAFDSGAAEIPSDINDLTDADGLIPTTLLDLGIVDGTNGQVLTTDGAGAFTFQTVTQDGGGGGGAEALNDLTDVTISSPALGQVLKYNGTFWVNDTDDTGDGGGASTFADLTDVPTGLTIDQIYEPAIAMLRVDNNSTIAYLFESHYAGNNPTLTLLAGTTIAFDLSGIAGHPFEIQDAVGDPYNVGLVHISTSGQIRTGADAQGQTSGTLYWRIQESISGTYRYQCTSHAGMVGNITVKRLSLI